MEQWKGLEPEGLGHELLTAWAPWVREDREGVASWNVRPRVDHGYHGDMPEQVIVVDRIVAKISMEHPTYWAVIAQFYLGEKAPWQIAIDKHRTEGWIRTMLLAACGLVEIRYHEACT